LYDKSYKSPINDWPIKILDEISYKRQLKTSRGEARPNFLFDGQGYWGFLIFQREDIIMSFEIEHNKWIKWHMSRRRGERKDALKRGHGYGNQMFAEKIWWPLTGHFDDLHPEFEVMDWRGRSYFVDFMWILGTLRFAIEIMDYGSHGKDRTKYRMDLNRALFLQSQQCHFIAISLDEMKENPSFIQSILRNMWASYFAFGVIQTEQHAQHYNKIERLLMRYAIRNNRIIRPPAAAKELELHKQSVIKYCRGLVCKGKLSAVPAGMSGRIYRYEYVGSIQGLEWS
jgi:hypothetical protein